MATMTIKKNPNYREIPFGGNDGDVLKKVGDTTSDQYTWAPDEGEGSSDYNGLENKPSINGVELVGDRTLAEFGIDIITSEYVKQRYDEIAPSSIIENDWKIDYEKQLKNLPKINNVELVGNKSSKELGIDSISPDMIDMIWRGDI